MKKLRSLVGLSPDPTKLCCDSWGLKKLFTYAIRKAGKDKPDCEGIPKRRESQPNINMKPFSGHVLC